MPERVAHGTRTKFGERRQRTPPRIFCGQRRTGPGRPRSDHPGTNGTTRQIRVWWIPCNTSCGLEASIYGDPGGFNSVRSFGAAPFLLGSKVRRGVLDPWDASSWPLNAGFFGRHQVQCPWYKNPNRFRGPTDIPRPWRGEPAPTPNGVGTCLRRPMVLEQVEDDQWPRNRFRTTNGGRTGLAWCPVLTVEPALPGESDCPDRGEQNGHPFVRPREDHVSCCFSFHGIRRRAAQSPSPQPDSNATCEISPRKGC